MTAKELLQFQLDDSGYQLTKTLDGLSEDLADDKATPDGMSARESVEHLCEAYEAVIAHMEGRTHEWGSYKIADKSAANLRAVWTDTRAKAVASVLAADTDDALKSGHAYIIAHDYYHVGQLCALRLKVDPSFDAYSIYRS